MALDIADPETDRLARELAELTGETTPDAVKAALRERLERERRLKKARDENLLARLNEIALLSASLPVKDDRLPDEIIGYDENGLPS